jgi:hypothetical protein
MLMKEFLMNMVSTPDMLRMGYQIVLDKLRFDNFRQQTL